MTKLGELDILVLGIGANGHLAFNEPGYDTDSRVGIVNLTPQTREANHAGFDSALTITLKTILSAGEIIVIASGKGKSSIVEEALLGEISLRVPASFLQHHLRTTYVVDAAAASPALKRNL